MGGGVSEWRCECVGVKCEGRCEWRCKWGMSGGVSV